MNSTTDTKPIQDWLVAQFARVLNVEAEAVDIHRPLSGYGLGSLEAVSLVGDMEDWLGRELPTTLLWDYPTLHEIALYLAGPAADPGNRPASPEPPEPAAIGANR